MLLPLNSSTCARCQAICIRGRTILPFPAHCAEAWLRGVARGLTHALSDPNLGSLGKDSLPLLPDTRVTPPFQLCFLLNPIFGQAPCLQLFQAVLLVVPRLPSSEKVPFQKGRGGSLGASGAQDPCQDETLEGIPAVDQVCCCPSGYSIT